MGTELAEECGWLVYRLFVDTVGWTTELGLGLGMGKRNNNNKKRALSLSHLVLWRRFGSDFENVTHQTNQRKDKRVDDIPVM